MSASLTGKNLSGGSSGGFYFKLIKRMIFLLLVSSIIGVICMFVNPNSPEYGSDTIREGEVPVESVVSLDNVLWVDARSADQFSISHVAGAVNVNEEDYYTQIGKFLSVWEKGMTVVVYCSSQGCSAAEDIAYRLRRELSAQKVYVLHGGWETILRSGSFSYGKGDE